jgi:phage terminase small subunit
MGSVLTTKELIFCEAYIRKQSVMEAAEEAGYSPTTAVKTGHTILARPHVQLYLESLRKKTQSVAIADAVTVINGYAQIAFASPFDVLEKDPETGLWKGLSPDEIPDNIKPAIKKVHITKKRNKDGKYDQEYKYELYDKLIALEKLGKHFNIFGETSGTVVNLNQYSNIPTEKLRRLEEAFKDAIDGQYTDISDDDSDDDASPRSTGLLAESISERGSESASGSGSGEAVLGSDESELYRQLRSSD